jgi:hypothetical protein
MRLAVSEFGFLGIRVSLGFVALHGDADGEKMFFWESACPSGWLPFTRGYGRTPAGAGSNAVGGLSHRGVTPGDVNSMQRLEPTRCAHLSSPEVR